ncbi:MAG: P-II family nitrogen regulator [Burkholderiales bacterium]|nr:P-II family nitrogen regulator [Burkholderiales bacterium]
MKQIIAMIQAHRLEKVENALHQLPHLPGFTLFHAHGHPRGKGPQHGFIATEWNPDAHDCVVLMMFCTDEQMQVLIDTIRLAAHTGHAGDGLIAVSNVDSLVRIRTGERDDAAV